MIQIENLTYTYPNADQPVLKGINLHIKKGEFVLLMGASGSGKSTLLRCLNGLVPHFSGGRVAGDVRVNGLDVVATGPQILSRHVGFVFQSPESQAVLDYVEPELAFGLENMGVPTSEMHKRVAEVLALLGLATLRKRPLTTLSGGERQRVAIGAALVQRPSILVLDEPTSQLDPQSAADVLDLVARLNRELGLTIILAEHRLERILPFANRLIRLEAGEIQEDRLLKTSQHVIPAKAGIHNDVGVSNRAHLSKRDLLCAVDVRFAYNDQTILNQVSLGVNPGEVVAVMGANGAGKSTLLKCLVGLLKPSGGDVLLNGRSIQNRAVADICREVAYLPQNPDDLLFSETVAEELQVTLKNHGIEGQERIRPLLAELGLADFAGRYPRDLSVGQRQRVALGAILVTQPKFLLLDEPTRGLDDATKVTLVAILKRYVMDGMGLLLVTHDAKLVAQIADRVLTMKKGAIVES